MTKPRTKAIRARKAVAHAKKRKSQPSLPVAKAQKSVATLPDDSGEIFARLALHPTVQASETIRRYRKDISGKDLDLEEVICELTNQNVKIREGDLGRATDMLFAQASTLDSIFGNWARRAAGYIGEDLGACELSLRLALKAQSQCRATLETLAFVKSPPLVYARQANIANGPQQVNNGPATPIGPPRPREIENRPNKQLEANIGERLVIRAKGAPSQTHSELEAVGKGDRSKNRGR